MLLFHSRLHNIGMSPRPPAYNICFNNPTLVQFTMETNDSVLKKAKDARFFVLITSGRLPGVQEACGGGAHHRILAAGAQAQAMKTRGGKMCGRNLPGSRLIHKINGRVFFEVVAILRVPLFGWCLKEVQKDTDLRAPKKTHPNTYIILLYTYIYIYIYTSMYCVYSRDLCAYD